MLWLIGIRILRHVVTLQFRRRRRLGWLLLAVRCCRGAVVRRWLTSFQSRTSWRSAVLTRSDRAGSGGTRVGKPQQPALNSLKFRTANYVFLVLREPRSQRQRGSATVRRRGVCCESARDETRLLLVLGFELLKHRRHCARIVTRGIHVLDAEFVSLFLSAPAELHEDTEQTDTRGVLVNQTRNSAEENRCAKGRVFKQARLGASIFLGGIPGLIYQNTAGIGLLGIF